MHKENENAQYVRASFNCRKEILDAFRKAVVEKYGRLWGYLNKEFEKALENRLNELKKENQTN